MWQVLRKPAIYQGREQVSEPVFKTYAEEIAYKRGFVDGDLFAEQRIIKLLEDDCRCSSVEECYCTNGWAIELIKGEDK
jgi:hypothetical protein